MRFKSRVAEREFVQDAAASCRTAHVCNRAAGALKWAALLPAGGLQQPLLLAALLVSVAAAFVAWRNRGVPASLVFPAELAVDMLQPALACTLFHTLYPAVVTAGPVRALACVLFGNGVLALAFRSKTSPLPFRWQLPSLVATGATLLYHTRTLCGSPLMQHGYRTLHTLVRIVLPLLAPAFMDLMPRDGAAALLAPAPPADDAGAMLCAAYQVPSVVLGCAALGCHLFAAEALRRKAFLLASGGASALSASRPAAN